MYSVNNTKAVGTRQNKGLGFRRLEVWPQSSFISCVASGKSFCLKYQIEPTITVELVVSRYTIQGTFM